VKSDRSRRCRSPGLKVAICQSDICREEAKGEKPKYLKMEFWPKVVTFLVNIALLASLIITLIPNSVEPEVSVPKEITLQEISLIKEITLEEISLIREIPLEEISLKDNFLVR